MEFCQSEKVGTLCNTQPDILWNDVIFYTKR